MKGLSFVAAVFAAFLIFIGYSSRETAGVLSGAVIFIGALMAIFVAFAWMVAIFKKRKNRASDLDNSNS